MTGRQLRRQAFTIWLTARPPRWYTWAFFPLIALGIAFLAVVITRYEEPPSWFGPIMTTFIWTVGAVIIAAFADSYRRIVRDLRRDQGHMEST
ncbi:hypothetical protein [Demequina aestuarii]|uniref:hypothetical protein n=1 Tax=Demequina aestuarii TaxID=327095 RepID=UPI0007859670|nr:hypothetical protein [Demequina aestuarii]